MGSIGFRELIGLAIAVVSLMLIFNGRLFMEKYRNIAIWGLIYVNIMMILVGFYRL